jgi:hypothetical protein
VVTGGNQVVVTPTAGTLTISATAPVVSARIGVDKSGWYDIDITVTTSPSPWHFTTTPSPWRFTTNAPAWEFGLEVT